MNKIDFCLGIVYRALINILKPLSSYHILISDLIIKFVSSSLSTNPSKVSTASSTAVSEGQNTFMAYELITAVHEG